MKNIINIIHFTFREALSKSIFKIFFAISTFGILILALILNFSPDVTPFSNDSNIISQIIIPIMMGFVPLIYGGGIFLSIFSTAGMTADMLEKGNIDLLLSKPIARRQLILGKFFGSILIVLINVAYAIFGIWIVIGIKFNFWQPNFLMTIFSITYAFALIYSLIMLVTILMRSSVLAMILSYFIFFILSPLLSARNEFYPLIDNKFVKGIIEFLYYVVPQTSELGTVTVNIASQVEIQNYTAILISFLLMLLILTASIITFNKKDY